MDQFVAMATFVRVVEAGSLSGAARAIPSSLTSVSRQIAALEARFGTQLLLRTTRWLSLTEDGRLFYDRAKVVLGELREVEQALSSGRRQPSGRLRVSAPSLMGRWLTAPLLAEFLRRYPSVAVDLLLVDRDVDLMEEDIHIALRVGRLPDSQLIVRKLADLNMVVCAAPDYLRRRGVPQVPGDLSGHDCLVFSDTPGAGEWRFMEHGRTKCKIRVSGRLWANSLDALLAAATEGGESCGCRPGRQPRRSRPDACSVYSLSMNRRPRRSICCFSRRGWPHRKYGCLWIIWLNAGGSKIRLRRLPFCPASAQRRNELVFVLYPATSPAGIPRAAIVLFRHLCSNERLFAFAHFAVALTVSTSYIESIYRDPATGPARAPKLSKLLMTARIERPLSPHLQTYRWTLTMALSIVHRATGIALYFGTLLLAWWLIAAATGPTAYANVQAFTSSFIGRLIVFGYTWALLHHLLSGIRHLVWDLGYGFKANEREALTWGALIGGISLTVLLWIAAYAIGGGR